MGVCVIAQLETPKWISIARFNTTDVYTNLLTCSRLEGLIGTIFSKEIFIIEAMRTSWSAGIVGIIAA